MKKDSKTTADTTQTNGIQTTIQPHNGWRNVGLIFMTFIAGFFGAWAFVGLGLEGDAFPDKISETRQKVISEGDVVADIAEQVSPSVVSIVTESTVRDRTSFSGGSRVQSGAGTGVIISKDGYVLTNRHVIPDGTSDLEIVTTDGKTYENVRVVGRDPQNDLAFLKINGVDNLQPAVIGDSSESNVGQRVVAIGNALGQFDATVTSGIISGVNRSVQAGDRLTGIENLTNLLQTDAAINPGNSGGPLVNISGEVIGINTAVSQDAEGIGFAIPINDAKGLIEGVLENGTVERAYLGVRYLTITPDIKEEFKLDESNGAYIIDGNSEGAIIDGSPADKAGLKSEDIIIEIDGVELSGRNNLVSELSQHRPGDSVEMKYVRDGKTKTTTVTLEKLKN